MNASELQELRDRERIRELYAGYCFVVDLGRPDLFASSFTEDGVMLLTDRGSFRGRAEIEAHVQRRTGKMLHLIHNVAVVRIEGDDAWAHAYFQLIEPESATCAAYGMYDDWLKRVGGRWYWHHKNVHYQYQSPEYAAGVERRADYGSTLDVPNFVEDLERGCADAP
jgi:uncharacterized protein (TIGR02246 family)